MKFIAQQDKGKGSSTHSASRRTCNPSCASIKTCVSIKRRCVTTQQAVQRALPSLCWSLPRGKMFSGDKHPSSAAACVPEVQAKRFPGLPEVSCSCLLTLGFSFLTMPAPREPVPRIVRKQKLNCICCSAAHGMQGLLLSIKSQLQNIQLCHLKLFTPASSKDFISLQAPFGCFSFLTLSFIPCLAPNAAPGGASPAERLLNTCSCGGGRQLPPPIYRVISAPAFPLTWRLLFPL